MERSNIYYYRKKKIFDCLFYCNIFFIISFSIFIGIYLQHIFIFFPISSYNNSIINKDILIDFIDSTTLITSQEIKTSLSIFYNNSFTPQTIFIRDEYYNITNIRLIKDFISIDNTNLLNYIPETYDCDDFSLSLMTNFYKSFHNSLKYIKQSNVKKNINITNLNPIFGIAYGNGRFGYKTEYLRHAFNIFYDNIYPYWFCIEPQYDTILPCDQFPYDLQMIFI